MIGEIVYLGYDNTIDLLLKADGSAQDLSAVTRMVLTINGTTIDSDVDSGVFDWTTGVTGKVIIALGGESLSAGRYKATLVVYDPTNDDGIVWGDFHLEVK